MIYFDNAATSWPKPPEVTQQMTYYLQEIGGSPGRSGHRLSTEAARMVFETRELLSELFNIYTPQQIAFTKNITEALNYALLTLLKPGDHVITTSMEHNSVMRPLRYLETQGVELSIAQSDATGLCNPSHIESLIKTNTTMIIINHASNVVGTIQPITDIGEVARKHNCIFTVDTAQTAGVVNIDVQKMNIDILGFTGHKGLLGPQGTGGIYIAPHIKLPPLIFGGTGSNSEFEIQPDFMPDMLESGTPNAVGIIGLGAGVKYILAQGIHNIRKHEMSLTKYFLDELRNYPDIKIYGPLEAEKRTAVISVNILNTVCSEVGNILDQIFNIMTRTGLHCAPTAHKTLGTFPQGTVRFSFGAFSTQDQVTQSIVALKEIAKKSKNA